MEIKVRDSRGLLAGGPLRLLQASVARVSFCCLLEPSVARVSFCCLLEPSVARVSVFSSEVYIKGKEGCLLRGPDLSHLVQTINKSSCKAPTP